MRNKEGELLKGVLDDIRIWSEGEGHGMREVPERTMERWVERLSAALGLLDDRGVTACVDIDGEELEFWDEVKNVENPGETYNVVGAREKVNNGSRYWLVQVVRAENRHLLEYCSDRLRKVCGDES